MLNDILSVSLALSPVILLFLLLMPLIRRRFGSKWMRLIWLILALRLTVPFRVSVTFPSEQHFSGTDNIIAYTEKYAPALDAPVITAPAPVNNRKVLSLRDLLPCFYVAVALLFFLWHLTSYLIFILRIRRQLIRREKYRRIWVYSCRCCSSPMLIGFIFPKIIIPDKDFSDNDLSLILKHEYAHFLRGDLWYKLLLCLVRSLHVFNPLVHLMIIQANRDIEFSCDEYVTKNTDITFRQAYSMAILNTIPKGE